MYDRTQHKISNLTLWYNRACDRPKWHKNKPACANVQKLNWTNAVSAIVGNGIKLQLYVYSYKMTENYSCTCDRSKWHETTTLPAVVQKSNKLLPHARTCNRLKRREVTTIPEMFFKIRPKRRKSITFVFHILNTITTVQIVRINIKLSAILRNFFQLRSSNVNVNNLHNKHPAVSIAHTSHGHICYLCHLSAGTNHRRFWLD